MRPRETFAVDRVTPGGNAAKAGLQAGDVITTVAGQPVQFFDELQAALLANKGKTVPVAVQRNGQPLTLNIAVSESGRIGFERKSTLQLGTRNYSLAESIPQGAKQGLWRDWPAGPGLRQNFPAARPRLPKAWAGRSKLPSSLAASGTGSTSGAWPAA